MIRPRPFVAGIAAWTVGAVASVAVGLLALSQVGEDFGSEPSRALAADPVIRVSPPPPSQPAPSSVGSAADAQPAATQTPTGRLLTSAGGNVVAQCHGADAYLVYWTPAQGYRAHDVVRGPAAIARVNFEGQGGEYELKIDCVDGVPTLDVEDEHDDEH